MGGSGKQTGASRSSASEPVSNRFPKEQRLRFRREFLVVQQTGRKFHGRHFLAVIAPSTSSDTSPRSASRPGRVGITASKKVGGAVVRNRIKRFVREYVRQHEWAPPGMDAVIIAKRSAAGLRHQDEIAEDLSRIGDRMASSCG